MSFPTSMNKVYTQASSIEYILKISNPIIVCRHPTTFSSTGVRFYRHNQRYSGDSRRRIKLMQTLTNIILIHPISNPTIVTNSTLNQ